MKYFERTCLILLLCLFCLGLGYYWRIYHEGGLQAKEKEIWSRIATHEIRIDLLERGMGAPRGTKR